MTITPRRLLKMGLGASQIGLLSGLGLLSGRPARAQGHQGPTRLLTIYLRGGWQPSNFFTPLADDIVRTWIPPAQIYAGVNEMVYYGPDDIVHLDGTPRGTPGDDPRFGRLRAVKWWDAVALSQGSTQWDRDTTPLGWSWVEPSYGPIYQRACVVHGVDQGTAAHDGGRISMMSGVAAARYQSPAIHAFVANHYYDEDRRPLGAVSIGGAPVPNELHVGVRGQSTLLTSLESVQNMLSERNQIAWRGFDGHRTDTVHPAYDGAVIARPIGTSPIDDYVLSQIGRLNGHTNAPTDTFYESLYEMNKTVSKQLALDIATTLQNTTGWEHLAANPPFWRGRPGNPNPLSIQWGNGNGGDGGGLWSPQTDLTLRLLKSGVCSAISLELRGSGGNLDTHSTGGQKLQFMETRTLVEVIGRLLAEMSMTTVGGRNLLDDTMVVISSEFARTYSPNPISGSDHWPITSVVLAGGGVAGNRTIGDCVFPANVVGLTGPTGAPVDLIVEGGDQGLRPPTSADIIRTSLLNLGVDDAFIPGGPGEIVGVRS